MRQYHVTYAIIEDYRVYDGDFYVPAESLVDAINHAVDKLALNFRLSDLEAAVKNNAIDVRLDNRVDAV